MMLSRSYITKNQEQNLVVDYDDPSYKPYSIGRFQEIQKTKQQIKEDQNNQDLKYTERSFDVSDQFTGNELDRDIPQNRDRSMNSNVYNANTTIYENRDSDYSRNSSQNIEDGNDTLTQAGKYKNEVEKVASQVANEEGFKPNLNAPDSFGREAKWHPHIDFEESDYKKYRIGSVDHDVDVKSRAHGPKYVGGEEQLESLKSKAQSMSSSENEPSMNFTSAMGFDYSCKSQIGEECPTLSDSEGDFTDSKINNR
eukprot:403366015